MHWFCDVTNWQGTDVNFDQIHREGFTGVWLKSSGSIKQGPLYIDGSFKENAKRAQQTPLQCGVFHYLMPTLIRTQVALMLDLLHDVAEDPYKWMIEVDIEQKGLTASDVAEFCETFHDLTHGGNLWIYTRKSFWEPQELGNGNTLTSLLHEAHWVSKPMRYDAVEPYASQQYHGVDESWWNVNYAGWRVAEMLQFTDHALIAGKYMDASAFRGNLDELMRLGD